MLANNIANASATGYKADREFHSVYSAKNGDLPFSGELPSLEGQWTDFSQGLIQNTGNALDFALSGAGFFSVKAPNGTLYTRSGEFDLSRAGVLTTKDGYPVLNDKGEEIKLAANRNTEVLRDGTIQQGGQTVGKLQLVSFKESGALTKQAGSYFRHVGPAESRIAATPMVQQGRVEASNVGVAESAVRLVSVMRQFEMLQKAVSVTGEMGRKSLEDLAKVGS